MSGRARFNTRSSGGNYNKQSYNTRNSNYTPAYSTSGNSNQSNFPKDHQQQQSGHNPQQPHYQPTPQTPQKPEVKEPQPVSPTPPEPKVVAQPPPITQPKPEITSPAEPVDVKVPVEDEEGKKQKPWFKRRAPDFKIPRRIRKRRQNARLKNLLAPKNAMMVLHELHPELKLSISEQINAANQMAYTVEIEIDGQTFKGMGMSKMAAKQAGSEAALKAVLLKKLEENNVKLSQNVAAKLGDGEWDEDVQMAEPTPTTEPTAMDTASSAPEGSENGQAAPKPKYLIPEDDVPWGSLASFALFKLFSEWQSQGFQLPAVSGIQNLSYPNKQPQPQAPTPMKKLPDDANTKHPVQLLNQIRPGCQYVENREGMPPNLTFTFSVVVDDSTFTGVGSSKKDAKKQCAKHALEHLGVVYTE